LIIEVDEEFREKLLKRLKKIRTREGYHVTDLIYCIRKKYYDIIAGEFELSERSAIATTVGTSIHRAIQRDEIMTEVRVEKDGIVGTVDEIYGDAIVEYKSTRGVVEPKENWVYQCMAYCYMTGKKIAYLVVVDVIRADITVFKLKFDDDELRENWNWIVARKTILEQCLKNKNPPPIEMSKVYDWECKICRWRDICVGKSKKSKNRKIERERLYVW